MSDSKKKLLQKKYEIKDKLYDYCMNERADRGCVGCPLDSLNICSRDIKDIDVRRLLTLSKKIDEVIANGR